MTILMLGGASFAATYDVELAIPSAHPTAASHVPADHKLVFGRMVHYESSLPDQTASTTDSRVQCFSKNGYVIVRFVGDSDDWPTIFPLTASCSYGGDTLNVDVVKMSEATDLALESGVVDNDTVKFTKTVGSKSIRSFALPVGTYTAGLYSSTLSGVSCRVWIGSKTGQPNVTVTSDEGADEGSGSCTLPRPGSTSYVLSLNVDSDEI